MQPGQTTPPRGRSRWALLGIAGGAVLIGVLAAWAAANTAPTITGAKGLEVRPDRTADYKLTFTLTVNDGTEDSYPDTVMVAVTADDDVPVADAGRNRTASAGEAVALSGSGTDPEGLALTYAWVQRGGPEVELDGAMEATATFAAPEVDRRKRLSFRLKVTDPGGNSGRDDVRVNVVPAANAPPVAVAAADSARIEEGATATLDGSGSSDSDDDPLTYAWTAPAGIALSDATAVAPTAHAGADIAAKGGDRVTLDGTGSSDPEGGPLTYAWTQMAGTPVTLSSASSPQPAFAAPPAGAALAFSLTVDDGANTSAADAVAVSVAAAPRVVLSLGTSSIRENGGSTTVTASLREAAPRPFEVTVSESSSAVALGGNATLAFAAGAAASTGTVTLSAVDDDVYTGDRTASIAGTLAAGAPARAPAPAPVVLTVADDEEDGAPDFAGASVADQAWAAGSAIAALSLPAAEGGDGRVVYDLTPALPAGLSFDPKTRSVAGTPKVRQAPTLYTYTATDADGDPASLTFRIAVGYWRLTVSPKPVGGTVTGPGGISCGSAGDATVDGGGATLTAAADAGFGLESWTGACASATGTACTLTLSAAAAAGATFGELPACNPSATGAGDACGAGSYALVSWSGAHGACAADETPGCGTGRMESHAAVPAAECGTSADSCGRGDWKDGTDTASEHRWTCAGPEGKETWTCAGSGGDWTWTCTGGGRTESCAGTQDGSSANCSRQSAGADASCFACRDGHHEHGGSCHADHACASDEVGGGNRECVKCPTGKVPNATGTACVCPAGEHEHDELACHATEVCHGDGDCADGDVCRNGTCRTPVDGGWTAKSYRDWGNCSETACGSSGSRERGWTRSCANPVPAHGGEDCAGAASGTDSEVCHGNSCAGGKVCWEGSSCETPVNGGWSPKDHEASGNCSATACGVTGSKTRRWSRTCSNPAPAFGGEDCEGESTGTDTVDCTGDSCAVGEKCSGGTCVCAGADSHKHHGYACHPTANCHSDAECPGDKVCSAGACECRVGHHWHGASCHADHDCGPDEIGGGDQECTPCPDNQAPNESRTACLLCGTADHEHGSGKCHKVDDSHCGSCTGGKVCQHTACVCPSTEHEHEGARTCHPEGHCHSNADCAEGEYCDNGACKEYREWTLGDWGDCSATACGQSGKQTRTVTCGGSVCDREKEPSREQSCSGDQCIAGEKSSERACICESDGDHKHDANACHPSGDCHANADCADGEYCDNGTCKEYREWTLGDWGDCSATCGQSGSQTRDVKCEEGNDCHPNKPAAEQACEGSSCPDGQECRSGACECEAAGDHKHGGDCHPDGNCHKDGDCSGGKVCKAGECVCQAGKHEHGGDCHPSGNCHSHADCADDEYCDNGACKEFDEWTMGDWGDCSATACGQSGEQTRTVACGGSVCDRKKEPSREQSCSGNQCITGEKCSEGACICESDGDHKHDANACHPSGNCHKDADCSGGKVCKLGKCVCPDGKHDHGGTCHKDHTCGPDEKGGGDEDCTGCPDGQVPNGTGDDCVACVHGESVTPGTCLACPSGCTSTSCGGTSVCKCPGSSCPQLWGQHENCTATQAKTCSGDTDGCGRKQYPNRCTTGSHTFGPAATESCLYEHRDRNLWRCRHWTQTCGATVTEVGCVYTGFIPPIIPPFPLASPPDGGYERGYLLAPFQCGSAPDTCRVEIGDEVLEGTEGVEDRDDTDAEHRWGCRSDTGEVRECSAEKE